MVLADFSKAFDTVQYKTLITTLFSLGFSKNFLRWLTSYLSNRFHFVQIDDQMSDKARVHFGVPQGSILGPMLFNLYVSDLQDNLPNSVTTFQYADDTTIYQSCALLILLNPQREDTWGDTWVNFCWVCAFGLSESLPHCSSFCGQL